MSIINPIQSQTTTAVQNNTTAQASQTANISDFTGFLNQALSQASTAESAANAENMALLTGNNSNIHSVVLAAEKAEIALRLTLQIRNKVIDAYNEMMRLQI